MDDKPRLYGADPDSNQQLYGVDAGKLPTTFREKLADMFKDTDFVRVINPDNEPFTWQSLNPKDEDYSIVPGPQKTTRRGLPKLFTIQPGDTLVLEGWNAYIMIEGLYKKISAKDRLANRTSAQANDPKYTTNFVWSDDVQQRHYIDKIFIGVEQPQFSAPSVVPVSEMAYQAAAAPNAGQVESTYQPPVQKDNTVASIEKDLGLDAQPSS